MFYTVDLSLGDPPQKVTLGVDTASGDTWVPLPNAFVGAQGSVEEGSVFEANESSTFHANDTAVSVLYVDGKKAHILYAQDILQIADSKLKNFNFAVANYTNAERGVVGIGYAGLEGAAQQLEQPYPNLPEQLKQQGVIQQAAYSLWSKGDSGSVQFGTIDLAMLGSDLYIMPVVQPNDTLRLDALAVRLSGVSIYDGEGNEQPFASVEMPALFASGSALSMMPLDIIQPFYDAIGARQFNDTLYIVDCDALNSTQGGLGTQFGGIDVTVGYDDLMVPVLKSETDNSTYCVPGVLGVFGATGAIIGDNILRTLYVVYDLDNNEIGVAAAKVDAADAEPDTLSTGIPGKRIDTLTHLNDDYGTARITLTEGLPQGHKVSSSISGVSAAREHSSITVPNSVQDIIVIGAKATGGPTTLNTSSAATPPGAAFSTPATPSIVAPGTSTRHPHSASQRPSKSGALSTDAGEGSASGDKISSSFRSSVIPTRVNEATTTSAGIASDTGSNDGSSGAIRTQSSRSTQGGRASSGNAMNGGAAANSVNSFVTALNIVLLSLL